MRVTQNAFTSSLIGQLNTLTSQQYNLQNQVSSGLRVQAPSDDPAAMEDTLNYQAANAAQLQYSNNISTLQSRATSIGSALSSLQTISSNAGEISSLAQDGTKTSKDLQGYAQQISQLIQQAMPLVNAKDPVTGQYLFGGTASGQPPFVATTDASGNVTGVTYQGNNSVNQAEIASGVTLSVDVTGANTSGSGVPGLITDAASGADFFNHLISLQNNLQNSSDPAIRAAIPTDAANLQNDENNLLLQVSSNGAVQNRLNIAATAATDSSNSLNTLISSTSSANLVQTMVQLNQAQNSYQAALQSGAKIMQLSLLNYLQ